MNATEFSFLALGLVLGIAVGAALVVVFRARPAPRREVRLTVAPNSIAARRPSTLATTDLTAGYVPAPGGPAGDLEPVHAREPRPVMDPAVTRAAAAGPVTRTPVQIPSGIPGPGGAGADPEDRTPRAAAPAVAVAVAMRPDALPLPATPPAEPAPPPLPQPARAVPAVSAVELGPDVAQRTLRVRAVAPDVPVTLAADTVAVPVRATAAAGDGGTTRSEDLRPVDAGPCAMERRIAVERCEVADRARAQAAEAAEVLARARRSYDTLRERVDERERLADPRELRAGKDAAHRAFREARAAAGTPADAEAAAREWLAEINRLNTASRTAAAALDEDREELRRSVPALERLSVEADAARIMSETAEAGCREAREALAVCEEAASAPPRGGPAPKPDPTPPSGWPADEDAPGGPGGGSLDPDDGGVPRVLRILRGDRRAREALVATVAGTDPEEVRRWRLALADLVDAIVARAIEDGYLHVGEDQPFWAMFDTTEQRDIVTALSALGFRFDGLGGFMDERVPAQRDLSLAVGYAGLDRMRVRNWPRETELEKLFAGATVAADEWLAAQAGDLSLGRMIDALGSRSAELADAWNAWGRVRPLLLATDAD